MFMGNRKEVFANGEYYHICNRGVDGRNIVSSNTDAARFVQSLEAFNTIEPVGSLYLLAFQTDKVKSSKRLVDIVAYCLNPNHFHLLLRQKRDGGISEFLKRLCGGYAWYFNKINKRKGPLFQGHFRAKYIQSNEHLLHASAYVNLNDKVHQLSGETAQLIKSSWLEYTTTTPEICKNEVILGQFKNAREYERYAQDTLVGMINKRLEYAELKEILFEE